MRQTTVESNSQRELRVMTDLQYTILRGDLTESEKLALINTSNSTKGTVNYVHPECWSPSPLLGAICGDYYSIVVNLVEKYRADVNSYTKWGTPLFMARGKIREFLIERGANVDRSSYELLREGLIRE